MKTTTERHIYYWVETIYWYNTNHAYV